MSKLPVPTAKEINEAHQFAREHAETAVEWAVKLGQMLQRKKDDLGKGKGQFDEWLGTYCKFSRATAYNYIKAGKSSNALDGFNSVREALGYESHKPGHKPAPKSLTGAKADAGVGKEPAPAVPVKPAPFAPVALTPPTEPAEPEWTDADEAAANEAAAADEQDRIGKAMAADDKLAEAFAQIKQQAILIVAANRARDHAMKEAAEALRLLKARDREIARLQKQIQRKAG